MVDEAVQAFPEEEVRKAIQICWQLETAEQRPPAPTAEKPGTIMDPLVEVDSHGVARCFVSIEKETGIDIPETEAKDTGYDSLDDLLENLVPLAKKYWEKQKSKLAAKKEADADSGTQ